VSTATTALLDVNILTALLWPSHEHHEAAHHWFHARGRARWATTPLTQLGFVRIVSNPAFSRDAVSPSQAVALLSENLSHPGHEFWTDGLHVPRALHGMESRLQGHQRFTDAYLLAVAHGRKGVLATFDRGLRSLAGAALAKSLEIVPTR
jgi:toxin-antitoxin system PIN domain toxin